MLIWRKFWGGKPESILRFIIEAQVPIEETLLFERGSLERERERELFLFSKDEARTDYRCGRSFAIDE